MLEALGQHAKGKSLNFRDGVRLSSPVAEHACKIGDFGDPPSVLLAIEFNRECHEATLAPRVQSNN